MLGHAQIDPDNTPDIQVHYIDNEVTLSAPGQFSGRQFTQIDVDPGVLPEGDYLGWIAFTSDGERMLVSNRMTDNITVFDWSTMAVITNINVGDYPAEIAMTDSQAIVACVFSDEIYVIDLDDYSIDTVFTVLAGQQPWIIRLSPDRERMFVACDVSNTCEVFNLTTGVHELTINDFPIGITSISWISENGRYDVDFSNFEVTSDGAHLVVGDWEDTLFFFNTSTGAVDHFIDGISNCRVVGLSGDSSIAVALSLTSPAVVHQIDLNTDSVLASVTITGHTMSMANEVGVNADGSKAFIGVSNNQSAIVRFTTSDFVEISQTYTPFWINTSPDHSLAIGGQYRFSIVDFASESVLGQHMGNSMYDGTASLVGSRAAGFDWGRHEGIYFYDYSTPGAPVYRGTSITGLEPEADAPRRIAITPDGAKAVVTNVLSDNVSIIDLTSYTVDTIIYIGDRPQNVSITSDGLYAGVCGFNSNSVKIIDLVTETVVADVPTNQGAGVVTISPDDHYAYIGNIVSNSVSVVELAGASSTEIAEVSCGVIGALLVAYHVLSDIEVSPTGDYVLIAASFDDQVKVLDTLTNTIVASLPAGDFPVQIAFDSSGDYATVTNAFADSVTIIHVDGASSSVVGTYSSGDYPLRLDYNEIDDEIGIGHYNAKTVVHMDPRTGSILDTDYYTSYGSLIQVLFDESGEPIVLTGSVSDSPGHLHRAADVIELPAVPSFFEYCPVAQKAVVTMPGPDYVTVVEWGGPGATEVITIPLSGAHLLEITPLPARSIVNVGFVAGHDEHVKIKVYDNNGRYVTTVANGRFGGGEHTVTWDGKDVHGASVTPGIYFVRMETVKSSDTKKMLMLR
jgi:YVTN family beta-propeller protein